MTLQGGFMKIIILSLVGFIAMSCGSTRYQVEKQKIDDQIWQCKELCSAGTIDVARIKGLNCMCRHNQQQQAPVIINNVLNPAPQQVMSYPQSTPTPVVIFRDSQNANFSKNETPVEVKNGYQFVNTDGRTITSTTGR